jgi:hypothetical protein
MSFDYKKIESDINRYQNGFFTQSFVEDSI